MHQHSGGSNVHAWWLAEIIDYWAAGEFCRSVHNVNIEFRLNFGALAP